MIAADENAANVTNSAFSTSYKHGKWVRPLTKKRNLIVSEQFWRLNVQRPATFRAVAAALPFLPVAFCTLPFALYFPALRAATPLYDLTLTGGFSSALLRFGQVAQDSGSPFGSKISGPPQEPRKQRPFNTTPTDMASMIKAISPTVMRINVMIGFRLSASPVPLLQVQRAIPRNAARLSRRTRFPGAPETTPRDSAR
jgi:hypothetical protein